MALLLTGSAVLLFSCDNDTPAEAANDEGLMTEFSENMTVIESENGRKSFELFTPLVEGYTLAKEPRREFREGIDITTFQKDTVGVVDTRLTADYAIFYIERQLWEAKGNVVVKKSNGRELYTQQLYWNQRTGRVWSNVDTRIVQEDGKGTTIVEGFESDQQLKDLILRRAKGRMLINVEPNREADTTAVNTP